MVIKANIRTVPQFRNFFVSRGKSLGGRRKSSWNLDKVKNKDLTPDPLSQDLTSFFIQLLQGAEGEKNGK
jgi:hypothetical protein